MVSPPCFPCPGSETHTAAGAAEHSLQRNDQVSDAAQQRGAGTVSYADLVVLQLLSHPIKSRTPCPPSNKWKLIGLPNQKQGEGKVASPSQTTSPELIIQHKILETIH